MKYEITSDSFSGLAMNAAQYLDAIDRVVKFTETLEIESQELSTLALAEPQKIMPLFGPSIPGGWFYEHSYIEHVSLFLQFSGLNEVIGPIIESGEFFNTDFTSLNVDPPEWLSADGDNVKKSIFMVALYTLQKSTKAIQITSKPINDLIREGRSGDRSALKLAIKLDALAITSPTVAAELLKSDFTDGGKFRAEIKSALRYPYRVNQVAHGMLRFVLRVMHSDGRLEGLSENDRYEFFCKRLQLYPDGFEAPASLNRFIRHCVKSYRT